MASSLEYRSIVEQQKCAAAECGLGLVRDVYLSSAAEAALLASQALGCAPDGALLMAERARQPGQR